MVRLVVTWSSGGYECTCEEVACIEYSSRDDFLLDLQIATEEYIKATDEYAAKYTAWADELAIHTPTQRHSPSKPPRTKELADKAKRAEEKRSEKHMEVLKRRPEHPEPLCRLNGFLFNVSEFICYEDRREYVPPNVETLEEWWVSKIDSQRV